MTCHATFRHLPVALVALAVLAACGSGDGGDGASAAPTTPASSLHPDDVAATTTDAPTTSQAAVTTAPATSASTTTSSTSSTTTELVEPLQVLVTNDDGVDAPGIDALVTALQGLPDVEITVVAPAENQSGTSMSLSEVSPEATPASTASGLEAMAVAGFPADSVRWAIDHLDTDFDLVVSGSNSGQNIGDFSSLSGTVGAARYGAQQGIPAIAVSQGFAPEGVEVVFDDSVAAAIDWIVEHRSDFEAGVVSLTSINAPVCVDGVRGVVVVPLGVFDGRDPFVFDCSSTAAAPTDDVDAFANGFTAITDLPISI